MHCTFFFKPFFYQTCSCQHHMLFFFFLRSLEAKGGKNPESCFLRIFLPKSLCTKNDKADHEITFPPIQKILEGKGLVGHFKILPE